MEDLWKGIAIVGVWTALAIAAPNIQGFAIPLGFFAAVATGFICMA